MLQALQRSFIWFNFNSKALNRIFKFINQNGNAVLSLVEPEDSTESAGKKNFQIQNPGEYKIYGGIKAVFWITVSIILAFLIGQL